MFDQYTKNKMDIGQQYSMLGRYQPQDMDMMMSNNDDVIDTNDDGEITIPMKKPQGMFSLKATLVHFPEFVVDLTVPKKKKDWHKKIEDEWRDIRGQFADKTPGTQKLYISKFRKAVKDAINDAEEKDERARLLIAEIIQGILIIEENIQIAVEEENRKRVKKYSTTLERLTEWEDLLHEFQLLLHHPDPRFLAVGLMAVTGRRFSEILKSGEIGPVYKTVKGQKIVQRYEVAFSGQAKTRGAKGTLYGQTYRIPVNAEAADVISAFESLRSSDEGRVWAKLDNKSLNSTPNKTLNRALKERSDIANSWPKAVPLSLKELRPFYAEIAYHYHAPDTITKGAYFSKILGHAADDYYSALSYMKFSLGAKYERDAMREMKRLQVLHEEQQEANKEPPKHQPDD